MKSLLETFFLLPEESILYLMVVILAILYFILRKLSYNSCQYLLRLKFFQIRDELRFKIFEGKLGEEDFIYKHFDQLINAIVKKPEKLTLFELVSSLIKNGKEFNDGRNKEQEELIRQIQNSPLEIKELIVEFYEQVAYLLVKQSKLQFMLGFLLMAIGKIIECHRPSYRLIKNLNWNFLKTFKVCLYSAKLKSRASYLTGQII